MVTRPPAEGLATAGPSQRKGNPLFPCPDPSCALISITREQAVQHVLDHADPVWVAWVGGLRVEARGRWELLREKRGKK